MPQCIPRLRYSISTFDIISPIAIGVT
jgi:hypothetical protein